MYHIHNISFSFIWICVSCVSKKKIRHLKTEMFILFYIIIISLYYYFGYMDEKLSMRRIHWCVNTSSMFIFGDIFEQKLPK